MPSRTLTVDHDGTPYALHVVLPDADGPRPAVLVCHAFAGQSDFERGRAAALAELGYVGVALDVYGAGVLGTTREECYGYMRPLVEDRLTLRARLHAQVEAVRALPEVDGSRMAAIGYCFGGLCALDLARSGAELRGVVSLHGNLRGSGLPEAAPVHASVLVLHGWDDPLVSQASVLDFMAEMRDRGVDHQLHAYGGAMHSFTNPRAADPDFGTVYNKIADRRSWATVQHFLDEVLAG